MSYEIVDEWLVNTNSDIQYIVIENPIISVYKALNILDPDNRIKFIIYKVTKSNNKVEYTIRARGRKDNILKPIIPLLSQNEFRNIN